MARRERLDNGDPSPWARPGFIAAAVVIVVAVACGVYALTTTGGHRNSAVPTRTHTATTATTNRTRGVMKAKTAAKSTDGCGVPPGPQAVPTVAPAGITWTLWRTVALPSSPTAGPLVVKGNTARCFAHSPLGALIAAVQIDMRFHTAETAEWRTVVYEQMVPSRGREKLAAEVEALVKSDPAQAAAPPAPGSIAQVAGFSFISYTPQTAVIDLVVTDSGRYAVGPVTVSWVGGDWKLDVQPAGTVTGPAQPISSTVGYVAWSGV